MKTTTLKTKAMSILLAIVMLLGMLPLSAFAAEGTYTISTRVLGTGSVSVKKDGTDVTSGTSGETYNLAGFGTEAPVGLYLLTEGESIPTENFEIASEFRPILAGAGGYDFTMPNEAVTIVAVFDGYVPTEISIWPHIIGGTDAANLEIAEWIDYAIAPLTSFTEEITLPGDVVPGFITVGGERYDFAGFIMSEYDEATDTVSYSLSQTLTIAAEPAQGTDEWYDWYTPISDGLMAAYMLHTHSYSAATCSTPATCSCGATSGSVDSTNHTYDEDGYQKDANGHWQLCSNENCPDADKGKTASTPHTYDGDTDAVCDTCDYTRLILVADKTVVNGNGTVTLTSSLPAKPICSDSRYQKYISGSALNWSFQMKNNVTTDLTFTVTFGSETASCTVSFVQDPNALILTPSSTTLVGNGTITLTANKDITGITCSNQSYETDISGSGANWQFVMNRNADVNLWFEATAADGETALCWITFTSSTHAHSYTPTYDNVNHWDECSCGDKQNEAKHTYSSDTDPTCDCGYDRGLFKVGTLDTDYVEVGFIPGDGVTLPDDAELVVGEHYPSLAPIASTVVEKTSLGDLQCPEEYDILTDEDTVGIYGIKCKLYETLVIGGLEYILWGSFQDGAVLLRLLDGRGMVYTGGAWLAGYPDSSFDRTVEQPTNTTVTIDGVTYDVGYIVNNSTYILYRDGQLAGMYPSTDDAADLHGSVQFYEGYDPETLKAQQDDNDLGSVTIPADYNNAAIADLAPGKTYKVSVIGANDISVEGYDDALLNSITEDTPEIAAAKAEVERLKADMDAKWWALTQMDINDPNYTDAEIAYNEASKAYASAYASLADLTNLQGATVTQTFKIPDALVGAKNVKYVAVHDTNPYAAELAEAEQAMKSHHVGSTDDPDSVDYYFEVKRLYDRWEKENGSGAEFGTVTLSLDGLTLTATHTAVKGFSPFIVYAFVEADEPEYKELSATLHTEHTYEKGKCTVCGEADPDYVPEGSSPQTGDNSHLALWIALLFISGGAVITLTVVDRKRRKNTV